MWRKIRSNYMKKEIFTYIEEGCKLYLIKYNKALQRIMGLNITDFQRFSKRYIEERFGGIIEYNSYNNSLIFEGHYSDGKRNGPGKEYNEEDQLIFKGEYLNGKKWERIEKKYDEYTKGLIFECEIKNGKRELDGKEYDKYTGDLLFFGKYLNGKRNGLGSEYKIVPHAPYIYGYNSSYHLYSLKDFTKNIKIFSGEYLNEERKEGREYNYEKIYYEGEFVNEKKNGKGIEYDYNKKYIGEFFQGKKHGKGKEYDKDKSNLIFEGEYLDDYRIKGKEYYKNGKIKFEGEYLYKKKYKGKIYDINENIIFELNNGNEIIEEYDNGMKIFIGENLGKKIYKEIVKGKEYDGC